jgi:hypothetical protein
VVLISAARLIAPALAIVAGLAVGWSIGVHAMSPLEIRELIDKRPYPGYRIYVSDGAYYDVRHPEMILVHDRLVHIAQPPMKGKIPAGENIYRDPIHVTRMEPLNGDRARSKGQRRKA